MIGGNETQILTLYATDYRRLQLIAVSKYLLVVNLSDESSIFAGSEVQLQALPEFDIIEQSTKLLQRSDIPSLHAACMRRCHVHCISQKSTILEKNLAESVLVILKGKYYSGVLNH